MLKKYYPASYHEVRSGSYIEYYVANPVTGKLVRKRIKLNRIKNIRERRRYARELMREINEKLASGWNPFIEQEAPRSFTPVDKVFEEFIKIKEHELRPDSIRAYKNYISRFIDWLPQPTYVVNISRFNVLNFLRYLYVERGIGERYYNNYIMALRIFWNWLIENGYAATNVVTGISKKKEPRKKRTIISKEDMDSIVRYLWDNDRYYLLAVYMCYYTLARPKEISMLRISDICSVKRVLVVPAHISKNGKERKITIPKRMQVLIKTLGICHQPADWYILGKGLKPGPVAMASGRYIATRWAELRKKLHLPMQYQFYSLKDTGIVALLRAGISPDKVRDQAGHSSLEMTNKYVQMLDDGADDEIANLDY